MINKKQLLGYGMALSAFLFLGAGCNSFIKNATNVVSTVTPSKMSELQYYNLAIEKANDMSEGLDTVQENYDRGLQFAQEGTCSFWGAGSGSTYADQAEKALITEKQEMENADKQKQVEEKIAAYLVSYREMITAADEYKNYCDREQFKDDGGAKIDEYKTNLVDKTNATIAVQSDFFELVKQFQSEIDFNIDENTTKPDEMAILIQNALTGDVDDVQEAYSIYAQETLNLNEEAIVDYAPVKTTYEKLLSDIEKYKQKADSIKLADVTVLGINYTAYLQAIDRYTIEFEKLTRDAENAGVHADNIITYDDRIVAEYKNVIDSHNTLVDSLDTYASMPQ